MPSFPFNVPHFLFYVPLLFFRSLFPNSCDRPVVLCALLTCLCAPFLLLCATPVLSLPLSSFIVTISRLYVPFFPVYVPLSLFYTPLLFFHSPYPNSCDPSKVLCALLSRLCVPFSFLCFPPVFFAPLIPIHVTLPQFYVPHFASLCAPNHALPLSHYLEPKKPDPNRDQVFTHIMQL